MCTIQDIFTDLECRHVIDHSTLNPKQEILLSDIIKCKTADCGFNIDICDHCGDTQIHYCSCKNPSCPMCQAFNREKWCCKEKLNALHVKYFHVVFTIPDILNPLVLLAPDVLYSILFDCSSEALKELALDPQYLGAHIGFTSVLHTWGQNLSLHPHVHIIVSGGGIDDSGQWRSSRKKFFLPVKALSKLFRGKFIEALKSRFPKDRLTDIDRFYQTVNDSFEKDWVVYTKKPLKNPNSVIEYLGRYTHRIAISNARIISHENGKVSFKYKDYKDHNQIKTMALDELEFFRRFMMHVLPKGFMKIRHYGFLGNRNKAQRLKTLRSLTNTPEPDVFVFDPILILSKILKRDVTLCPSCGLRRHHQLE